MPSRNTSRPTGRAGQFISPHRLLALHQVTTLNISGGGDSRDAFEDGTDGEASVPCQDSWFPHIRRIGAKAKILYSIWLSTCNPVNLSVEKFFSQLLHLNPFIRQCFSVCLLCWFPVVSVYSHEVQLSPKHLWLPRCGCVVCVLLGMFYHIFRTFVGILCVFSCVSRHDLVSCSGNFIAFIAFYSKSGAMRLRSCMVIQMHSCATFALRFISSSVLFRVVTGLVSCSVGLFTSGALRSNQILCDFLGGCVVCVVWGMFYHILRIYV